MDPDANLKDQLTIAAMIADGTAKPHHVDRLAELVIALHEWIAGGGFLPSAWRRS